MDQYQYSIIFNDIESRGYILHFYQLNSPFLELRTFGIFNYDSVFLFLSGKSRYTSKISNKEIYEFTESGGNAVFMADHSISHSMQELVSMYGVKYETKGPLVDHFKFNEVLDFE